MVVYLLILKPRSIFKIKVTKTQLGLHSQKKNAEVKNLEIYSKLIPAIHKINYVILGF